MQPHKQTYERSCIHKDFENSEEAQILTNVMCEEVRTMKNEHFGASIIDAIWMYQTENVHQAVNNLKYWYENRPVNL